MTEEILEILYKRLLMTIVEAPMPKLSAFQNWPAGGCGAVRTLVSEQANEQAKNRLTDITPNWSNIADVVVPYQLVDEEDQVGGERPANKEYSASVACLEMQWAG